VTLEKKKHVKAGEKGIKRVQVRCCSDWCQGGGDDQNLVSGYNECHPGPQQVLHCCMGPGII